MFFREGGEDGGLLLSQKEKCSLQKEFRVLRVQFSKAELAARVEQFHCLTLALPLSRKRPKLLIQVCDCFSLCPRRGFSVSFLQ
jgi:hypothetical protein